MATHSRIHHNVTKSPMLRAGTGRSDDHYFTLQNKLNISMEDFRTLQFKLNKQI